MAHGRGEGWGQYLGVGFVVCAVVYLYFLATNFRDLNFDGQITIADIVPSLGFAFHAPGWWIAAQFPVEVQQFFEIYAGNATAPIILSVLFYMLLAGVTAWLFDTFFEQIVGKPKRP